MVDILGSLIGAGNLTVNIIYFSIFSAIVLLLVKFFTYNVSVRINELSKGSIFIRFDRGRMSKDKKGNPIFKLLFSRKTLRYPPSNSIKIGKRGKRFIDYYLTEDGAYLPIKDKFDFEKYKEKNKALIKAHLEAVDKHGVELSALEDIYCPITGEERVVIVSELEASEAYKRKSFGDYALQLAPYAILVIILVVFLAFFGDVVEPITEQGKVNAKVLEKAEGVLDKGIEILEIRAEQLEGEKEGVKAEEPPN